MADLNGTTSTIDINLSSGPNNKNAYVGSNLDGGISTLFGFAAKFGDSISSGGTEPLPCPNYRLPDNGSQYPVPFVG